MRDSKARYGVVVVAVLLAALGLRIGYMDLTPGYEIAYDARDYDAHARSIAIGDGFSKRLTGKPTAFRPPGYPYLLGGAYRVFGVERGVDADRIRVARALGAVLGMLGVGLIGVLGVQLLGRTTGLIAMGLAAVYVPSILVSEAIMSEQLFVVLMLGALVTAIHQRRSAHHYAFALLAGLLAGLAVLTRANGLILLVPLALAVWAVPRRSWHSAGPPAVLVAVALATVAPWTIRNAVELHAFVPVTTQLGWALAGTYNNEARNDQVNPGSWRSLRRVPEYRPLVANFPTVPEIVMERRLSRAGREFIGRHPSYLATVAYWNTRRLLDIASWHWSRHTASTIGVDPGWANAGVVSFWIAAVLALVGATRRAARRVPRCVWILPLAMYLSVVFLAAETPRYRAPLDPFIVLLAAIALTPRRVRTSNEVNSVKSSLMISKLRRKTMLSDERRTGAWSARRQELGALRFVLLGLVLLFGFTAVFSAAFHNPQPHQVRVAIVGPPSALAQARGALDPMQFYAVRYASENAARAALEHAEVHGALVGGRVLIASASGFVAAQTTAQALMQVSARIGPPATLVDISPLPSHDSRGLSSFVTVISTTIASIVVAVLLTLLGGGHPLRARLTALLLTAGLGGLAVALSVDTTVGALTGDFLRVAGVIALLILAVVLCVHGLGRLVGHAGAGVAAMAFVLVGVTSAGGGVGHEFQPGFFRAVSQIFPNGAAVTALRNGVYLTGAHSAGALLVLCAWAGGGALALLAGHHRGPLFSTN